MSPRRRERQPGGTESRNFRPANVSLINGNFALWSSEKKPVTTETSVLEPRRFKVKFRDERRATRAEVLEAVKSKSSAVVDARSEGEFTGSEKHSKRSGHIPEACHLEWTNLVDTDGRFIGESAQRAKLEKADLKLGTQVITRCQGGGRASVDAFAIERLGFKTKNYYRGWSDWGNADDTPIEGEKTTP